MIFPDSQCLYMFESVEFFSLATWLTFLNLGNCYKFESIQAHEEKCWARDATKILTHMVREFAPEDSEVKNVGSIMIYLDLRAKSQSDPCNHTQSCIVLRRSVAFAAYAMNSYEHTHKYLSVFETDGLRILDRCLVVQPEKVWNHSRASVDHSTCMTSTL